MSAVRIVFVCALVCLWGGLFGSAEEPSRAGFLLRHNLMPLKWELIDGHIVLANLRSLPTSHVTSNSPTDPPEWKETMVINPSGEEVLIYRFVCGERTLSVEWKENTLTIQDQRGKEIVHFTQNATGAMNVVLLTDNQSTQEVQASSLWHLAILHAELFEEELMPRFDYLSGSWNFREKAQIVRTALEKEARSNWPATRREYRRAVEDLAADDYRTRQTALAKLKAGGLSAMAFMRGLPAEELDVEQVRNIHFLMQETLRHRDDPAQIAGALVYDQPLWWEMLAQPSATTRELAAEHLSRLLEREIRFNPLDNEQNRVAQLRLIRESLQNDLKR